MEREKYLDSVSAEFMAILHKYVPKEFIEGNGYIEMSFEARLSEFNKSYSDSEYFYSGPKKFIHWTSIQNLMSIINHREIRFYNLHNSSDADEFHYAAKHLKLSNEIVEFAKQYLFTFSFCESSELNNNDLWNEYGNNYEGAAIEFEIVNDPMKWKKFILAPILYGIPKNLEMFVNELENFQKKYPAASGFVDFGKLIAFHKKPDFDHELEIRLSTYYPFQIYEEYEKYCNTEFRFEKGRPRVTEYFGLKLFVNNESPWITSDKPNLDRKLLVSEDYFIEKPKIKISNIYFGKNCKVSNDEFNQFRQRLEKIIKLKFGYDLPNLELNLFG